MRAIITGGTGYIGQPLAARLAQDGYEVIILTRQPADAVGVPAGVQAVRWDGRTTQGWGHLVDGADAIVNLAGERMAGPSPAYRWTDSRKRILCDSRRNPGLALTEAVAAAAVKPKVLIQGSGLDYYQAGDAIATEDMPPGSGFLSYVCKECWEPSTQEVEAMGTRRAIIRTAPVIGENSAILAPLILQHKLFAGGRIGSGQQWFSWVHLDDVIGAIRFLIEQEEAKGPFNLVAPNPVINAELSQTLGRLLGRPSMVPAPAVAFRLAFGEMASTLLEGVRGKPQRLLDLGYDFRFATLESALKDILDQ
jgi:uncharacterized protein (TIGR01777 family)